MVNAANEKLLPKFKNDPNLTDQEQNDKDVEYEKAAKSAKARLDKIKQWSEVDETKEVDESKPNAKTKKDDLLEAHKERLNRYRQRKEWEKVVEEDDMDLDGERILAEIKNYKLEHFFNTNFYK